MNRIGQTVYDLALPVVEEAGLELWDVEYVTEAGQKYLRLHLDGPEGIDPDGVTYSPSRHGVNTVFYDRSLGR